MKARYRLNNNQSRANGIGISFNLSRYTDVKVILALIAAYLSDDLDWLDHRPGYAAFVIWSPRFQHGSGIPQRCWKSPS
jgi:hypothetical protein